MDKTLQEQLTEVEALLEQEKGKGPQKDADVITRLEQQQADILLKMDAEKAKVEQEAAQKVVIQAATEDAAYFLDNLVIEGLTMRQLTAGESEYQMVRIAVQRELISRAEKAADDKQLLELQLTQFQRQYDGLQKKLDAEDLQAQADAIEHTNLMQQIAQLQLEKQDSDSKRDAAMARVDALESQIDILKKEVAAGAQQSYQVVDLEAQAQQMKELADKIKANRIHVYDVVPDNDINPKNFTAKRVDNGEIVTYNWTQENNYIVLKDEAEAARFRTDHATQAATEPAIQDTPLVTIPEALHVTGDTFPSQSEVPTPDTVDSGTPSTNGQGEATVTTEERLTILEQSNLEMQTWIDSIEKRVGAIDGKPQQAVA